MTGMDATFGRGDPLDILAAQARHRIAELLPLRYERMRASPFAFFRGAAAIMAADLGAAPHSGVVVQLCGDAHLQNFGSFASPEGLPLFDVNDFDETIPGPFEWDVKRLAASLAVCARSERYGKSFARSLAARAARHYRRHMRELARLSPLAVWQSRIDLDAAIEATPPKLRRRLRRRLRAALAAHGAQYGLVAEGVPPLLRDHGFTRHVAAYAPLMRAAFAAYPASQPPHVRALLARYRLEDVAFKVVGVGSVGTFCAIGLFLADHGAPLLLQLKEAQASVLAPYLPACGTENQGERAVFGQRMMQAAPDVFLGWAAEPVDGRCFYVRSLKDGRLADLGTLIEEEALEFAAELCGRTLARAHARSGDPAAVSGAMGEAQSFETAIADFAAEYVELNEADYARFCAAHDSGRLGPLAA